MTSFQAKTGRERLWKREKKKFIDPISSYLTRNRELQKNCKKMASFEAKTGWERPRKSENKNYHSYHFLLDP